MVPKKQNITSNLTLPAILPLLKYKIPSTEQSDIIESTVFQELTKLWLPSALDKETNKTSEQSVSLDEFIQGCESLSQQTHLEVEQQLLDKLHSTLEKQKAKPDRNNIDEIKKWTDKIIARYGDGKISIEAYQLATNICNELNLPIPSINQTTSQQFLNTDSKQTDTNKDTSSMNLTP